MSLSAHLRSLALFVSLPVCACKQMDVADSLPHQATPPSAVQVGVWGGDAAGLDVTSAGATVEFDCAHGSMASPLLLDESGRFALDGVYVQEHGGPIAVDDSVGLKARYEGTVSGGTMNLTVTNLETGEKIGAYTLAFGTAARIRKCL